jgi:CheY-like chemotaxis protein
MTRPSVVFDSDTMPMADAHAAGPVLVVDGCEDTRDMYGQTLTASGVPVIYAADGREALVQIHQAKPRALVADLMLPFIDALQLCALIRTDITTASMRIVVITSDPTRAHRILQRGADEVLVKPISLEALTNAVRAERPAAALNGNACERPSNEDRTGRRRIAKVRAHERYVTRQPPLPPPPLKCPLCDASLQYDRSNVGGVSDRHPEQWDSFVCAAHGVFQYRHRTRRLRRVS